MHKNMDHPQSETQRLLRREITTPGYMVAQYSTAKKETGADEVSLVEDYDKERRAWRGYVRFTFLLPPRH